MGESFEFSTLNFLPSTALFFDGGCRQKIGANDTDLEIQTETFRFRKRLCDSGRFKNRGKIAVFSIDSVRPSRSTTVPWASQRDQNPAVGFRTFRPPAVSAKSKSTDRRVLRLRRSCSRHTPRNTTPELVETSADTRDLRLRGKK